MSGPYFVTELEADIRIRPYQMNNNIMNNIKKNLEEEYSNKCYDNYGYITNIIDVDKDIKGGIIRAEDRSSSSVHRVKFKCKICNPIRDSIIMGKIVGINNVIIVAENGPIRFIISESEINNNNIQFRKSAFYPVTPSGEVINKPIGKGTYVFIRVMSKKIVAKKNNIIVFGRLENVMQDSDVEKYKKLQYESNEVLTAEQILEFDKKKITKQEKEEPQESSTNIGEEGQEDDEES